MFYDETMQARIVKMALEWVEQLLSQNRIAAKVVFSGTVRLNSKKSDKECDYLSDDGELAVYEVGIRVYKDAEPVELTVGVTCDKFSNFNPDVLWDNEKDIIWFNDEMARKYLEIEEFKI